jgi:hypothetical protein
MLPLTFVAVLVVMVLVVVGDNKMLLDEDDSACECYIKLIFGKQPSRYRVIF